MYENKDIYIYIYIVEIYIEYDRSFLSSITYAIIFGDVECQKMLIEEKSSASL